MSKRKKTKSVPAPDLVLGVDAGGSKTVAVAATPEGEVLGLGRALGANYQACGEVRAGIELSNAIRSAVEMAGSGHVAMACYGIAGADRDKDFYVIRRILDDFDPAAESILCNDTSVALRAGTDDGVGIALIGGTGSNCMGFNAQGEHYKVGGMGWHCGDYGSADYLVKKAMPEAWKGFDGRGPKTLLTEMFARAIGVDKLEDIVEFEFADNFQPMFWHRYAYVVFEAAGKGDPVAIRLLDQTGKLAAQDAVGCMKKLFRKGDPVTVVLGGSVYQKGAHPALVEGLKAELAKRWPNAAVKKLRYDPVVGAVLWAIDHLIGRPAGRRRTALVRRTYKELSPKIPPPPELI